MPMNFINQTLESQTIALDGAQFENCIVKECQLIYRGGALPSFSNVRFEDSTFSFEGAASRTLKFMSLLYREGNTELVEDMWNEVRGVVQ